MRCIPAKHPGIFAKRTQTQKHKNQNEQDARDPQL
jgi:hypothetical protein